MTLSSVGPWLYSASEYHLVLSLGLIAATTYGILLFLTLTTLIYVLGLEVFRFKESSICNSQVV